MEKEEKTIFEDYENSNEFEEEEEIEEGKTPKLIESYIPIDDNFAISTDAYNFKLMQKNENGNYKIAGYFQRLTPIVKYISNFYIKNEIKLSKNVEELLKIAENHEKILKKVIDSIKEINEKSEEIRESLFLASKSKKYKSEESEENGEKTEN